MRATAQAVVEEIEQGSGGIARTVAVDVERTFSANTTSHYRTTKAFLPGMFDGVTTKFDWILPILREPMRSAMGRRASAWR